MRQNRVAIIPRLVAFLVIFMTGSIPALAGKKPLAKKENPLFIGNRDINNNQINFYSLERETALGRQLAFQVEMQAVLVDDPVTNEYVNRIGQNLAIHSDAKVPFTIKVIASEEINAFALPGGFLYVNLGVLHVAESESELAAVMAHEIAHVAARHALENLSKRQLLSLGAIPLIFLGGPVGELGRAGANFGLSAAFFKFSRGAEKEADELGAQYLWAAGYAPGSLITFFEKLERRERPIRVSPLFRTHPTTPNRIKNVRKLISRFPARNTFILNTSEFEAIKRRGLGGLPIRANNARRRTQPRRPPNLHRHGSGDDRRMADTQPEGPTASPATNGRQPPILYRRTADDPPAAKSPTPSSTAAPTVRRRSRNQPPTLIRSSTARQQSGKPVYSQRNTSTRPESTPTLPRPGERSRYLPSRRLYRSPPRLRRRF